MTQLEFFAALANGAKWGVPASISRSGSATGGLPIDAYSIFDSKAKAELYASQNKAAVEAAGMVNNAYVGQIITVWESNEVETDEVDEDGQPITTTVDTVNVYYIDADKTLKPVGIVPTGDGATIEVTAAGLIALKGFANAGNGTVAMRDENGNFTWKTLEEIGAGDGNSVTEVTAADKSINVEDKAEESFEGHKYEVKVNRSAKEGNILTLEDDGLYVADHPEYAIVKDETPTDGSQATYHLTKDGVNTDVAIEIPTQTDYTVTMISREDAAGDDHTAFKHYVFSQNGVEIGHVDVPVDLVVQSGSIITATVDDVTDDNGVIIGDKYIKLVIANQTEPIYIAVKDLIDIYTVDNTATVKMTLTDTNEITADVKISAEAGNSLVAKDDGLYVNAPTLPTVADEAVTNEYVTAVAQTDGKITVSRKQISYNELADLPTIPEIPDIVIKDAEALDATADATIAVIAELTATEHEVTPKTIEVASKKGLEDLASLIGVKANEEGQVATGVFADIALINQALTNKVERTEATQEGGVRFINNTEIAKLAALNLEGNEITISGSVNASQVKELAEYITDLTTGSGYKIITADVYTGSHPGPNGPTTAPDIEITAGKQYQLIMDGVSYDPVIAERSTGDEGTWLSFTDPNPSDPDHPEILTIGSNGFLGPNSYSGKQITINEVVPRLEIEEGAQENKIEAILLPGAALPLTITEKTVTLPAFIENGYGLIKGASLVDGEPLVNKLYANEGVGEVKAISTDILVNGEEEFILFGGNSGAAQA